MDTSTTNTTASQNVNQEGKPACAPTPGVIYLRAFGMIPWGEAVSDTLNSCQAGYTGLAFWHTMARLEVPRPPYYAPGCPEAEPDAPEPTSTRFQRKESLDIYHCGRNNKYLVSLAEGIWVPMTAGNAVRTLADRCGLSLVPPLPGLPCAATNYLTTISSNPSRIVDGYGLCGDVAPGLYRVDGLSLLVLKRVDGPAVPSGWLGAKLQKGSLLVPVAVQPPTEEQPAPVVEPETAPTDMVPSWCPPAEEPPVAPAVFTPPPVEVSAKRRTVSLELQAGDMEVLHALTTLKTGVDKPHTQTSSAEKWCELIGPSFPLLKPRALTNIFARLSTALPHKVQRTRLSSGLRCWTVSMNGDHTGATPVEIFNSKVNG